MREHLGGEIAGVPVLSRPLDGYQRPIFQAAIDAYLDLPERETELIGLAMTDPNRIRLAELVKGPRRAP